MAKRRATTELNRDNWDLEEESEDPGTFKCLSEDQLKNRPIRKAKRSLGNREGSGSSPFSAFSGFAKSTTGANPFGFLKNDATREAGSLSNAPSDNDKKENGSSTVGDEKEAMETQVTDKKQGSSFGSATKQKATRSFEYYRQLQSLNESLMKWMQLHLAKNSCCDFTPVFNDYKKHLETLNFTYPIKTKDSSSERKEFVQSSVKEEDSGSKESHTANQDFKFGNNSHKKDDETDYGAHFKSNTTNTSTFSFGISKTPTATSSNTSRPTTSLGKKEDEQPAPPEKPFQFSFGLKNTLKTAEDSSGAKPFSFAVTPSDKSASSELAATEESEYVPPKNDFIAVKEEDAFYSKRCKLFYKKDDAYVERGIGVLHLKPLDGKTQLLIRADTNLGNILLNIVLSESLPIQKTGKNNVLLVCVPNPPLDSKEGANPIPMLIRVKSSEDANELLETLNKHKS